MKKWLLLMHFHLYENMINLFQNSRMTPMATGILLQHARSRDAPSLTESRRIPADSRRIPGLQDRFPWGNWRIPRIPNLKIKKDILRYLFIIRYGIRGIRRLPGEIRHCKGGIRTETVETVTSSVKPPKHNWTQWLCTPATRAAAHGYTCNPNT